MTRMLVPDISSTNPGFEIRKSPIWIGFSDIGDSCKVLVTETICYITYRQYGGGRFNFCGVHFLTFHQLANGTL